MKFGPFRSIEDVLRSHWAAFEGKEEKTRHTDRIFRSTKLEDSIYYELRNGDPVMDEIEAKATKRLRSFPAFSRDVFQSFYSLMPRRNEESELSCHAQKFNRNILEHMMKSEDYSTLKNICEGREMPAYEAAEEFIARTAEELDHLLSELAGDEGTLNTLEKLQDAQQKAEDELAGLLRRLRESRRSNGALEQAAVAAANKVERKRRQVEAVDKMIDSAAANNRESVTSAIANAVKSAAEKAEEVQMILGGWSNEPGNMEHSSANAALLAYVRENPNLKVIARYLGRFREVFAQGKHKGYAYGRGEKYSLELGNSLSRALTSEMALLASPLTVPLFLRKYQRKEIKQYRRREAIHKGTGDIIVCLDESGSTEGDAAAWGKAVALTLLDIATDGKRNFALIHFSGPGNLQTNLFRPGLFSVEDKLAAAQCFLNGGTNFETPLREALQLMDTEGFENADIVFITDGNCDLPEEFAEQFRTEQAKKGFRVTGILLDTDSPGCEFSLLSFCQKIYRTSEMMGDVIVKNLIYDRV